MSESTLVKIPHCWKSHVMTQLLFDIYCFSVIYYMSICVKNKICKNV